jgi:hypothetical protein
MSVDSVLVMMSIVIGSVVGIFLFKKIALAWSSTYGNQLHCFALLISLAALHWSMIQSSNDNYK